MAAPELNPPPSSIISHVRVGNETVEFSMPYQLVIWLSSVFNRLGQGPFSLQGYTVQALPSAQENGSMTGNVFSSLIFISNESGGPTLAFSDGTNWRRTSDNAIVS